MRRHSSTRAGAVEGVPGHSCWFLQSIALKEHVSVCPNSEVEARVAASGVLRVTKAMLFFGIKGVADHVEDLLRLNRLPYVRINSSMLPRQRSEAVRAYNHDLQVDEAV